MRYERAEVERLLPLLWDDGVGWGVNNPSAPSSDMPRAHVDPALGNTILARLADVQRAWHLSRLSTAEMDALTYRFRDDLGLSEVGQKLGVSRQTAGDLVSTGVGRILTAINNQGYLLSRKACARKV